MQSESSRPLYRGAQIVWYTLYLVETFLIIRFLLKLFSANPGAPFTEFIYTISGVFTWPFVAVFNNDRIINSVLEWTTLLAMVVYWLLATAIIKLFVMSKSVSTHEADVRLTEEENQ
ncbi:YggT family protein [Candidatus Kaiserbacteria bacterium CG_4_8_14_3_um_filter_38_9]|uniref:YggT family protein n=1 Tax=Candidatus Kaiserbacteria bacterium CG_4_8_14_3_um_filter_38_9 TaxID=1974599 RepID=A0A2M7IN86_9BACT|nr:MAG: YggT family protein [Candidatus Kaiserbacteria bacterium CG_4_8_14_3_um_filter_38_9]